MTELTAETLAELKEKLALPAEPRIRNIEIGGVHIMALKDLLPNTAFVSDSAMVKLIDLMDRMGASPIKPEGQTEPDDLEENEEECPSPTNRPPMFVSPIMNTRLNLKV